MGVRDHQLHALEAALDQAPQERGPEGLGLARAEVQADDLAPPLGVDRHGDYGGDGDDPAAVADLQVGRVQPQVGPLAFQRAGEEGVHALVDVLAQLGDGALRDAGQAHRLHQLVHAPGRDAADPRLLDDGDQRLLAHLPGLEEGREVGALAQLRHPQLERAEPGVERALAEAVAVVQPLRAALVPPGADQAFHVALHQQLQHGFRDRAQEVAIAGLLQQLGQWQSVLGHRSSSGMKLRNSTLAERPDDHLERRGGGAPAPDSRRSLRRAASHRESPPPPWTLAASRRRSRPGRRRLAPL